MLCSNNQYIHLCIDAIIPQLKNTDELIIVDDHSRDETLKVLHKYETENLIKLLQVQRQGNRSYNRNYGASYAQNDILVFVDGDIILSGDAVKEIKKFYRFKSDAAAIGLMHATRYSEKPLELLTGITNFVSLISTEAGRKQINDNSFFRDSREETLLAAKKNDFFWLYYYSGFCTVKKNIFDKLDGFDITFNGWGAEDVDLGYRISLYDTIGFLPNCYGIHIPHARNMLKIEYNNYRNLRNMFHKYHTWQFEVLTHYRAKLEVFESFQFLLGQMQLLDLSPIQEHCKKNVIYVNAISREYPYGRVTYYDIAGNTIIYEVIGMIQPVSSNVEKVFISENIFIYPPEIASIILQEALNISNSVYICPSQNRVRICWDKKNKFFYCPSQYRLKYTSRDIMDYFFQEENGMLKVTSNITAYLEI